MVFGLFDRSQLKFMNLLKNALISPIFLTLFNISSHATLDPDDYDFQVGCVLVHQQPDGAITQFEY